MRYRSIYWAKKSTVLDRGCSCAGKQYLVPEQYMIIPAGGSKDLNPLQGLGNSDVGYIKLSSKVLLRTTQYLCFALFLLQPTDNKESFQKLQALAELLCCFEKMIWLYLSVVCKSSNNLLGYLEWKKVPCKMAEKRKIFLWSRMYTQILIAVEILKTFNENLRLTPKIHAVLENESMPHTGWAWRFDCGRSIRACLDI